MKWFTTLHSLHQHVWHIERISMTTLTFDEGTENCFESMESTDPSWVLRCKVKIYYMALKSFFWNIGVYPKPSQGRHKNIWIREQIWQSLCFTGVQLKKMRKNWCPRLWPVPTSSQVTQRLWTELNYYFLLFFIYLFLTQHCTPSPIIDFLLSLLEETQTWFVDLFIVRQTGRNHWTWWECEVHLSYLYSSASESARARKGSHPRFSPRGQEFTSKVKPGVPLIP